MNKRLSYGWMLLSLAALPLLTGPAWGNGCFIPARRVAVVNKVQVIRKTVFINRYVAVPFPIYLTAYATPPVVAPPAPANPSLPGRPLADPGDDTDTYTPPARRAAPRAQPYSPPVQRRAAPAYEEPVAPRAAPGYGNGNEDRILSALERLEARLDDLESRVGPKAAPRDVPSYPKKATPRKMPKAYEQPPDDPEEEEPVRAPARKATRQAPRATTWQVTATVENIIVKSCASCHDARRADVHGKGFVLVKDGRVRIMNDRLADAIEAEITGNTMPPRPVVPMVASEKRVLLRDLRKSG